MSTMTDGERDLWNEAQHDAVESDDDPQTDEDAEETDDYAGDEPVGWHVGGHLE